MIKPIYLYKLPYMYESTDFLFLLIKRGNGLKFTSVNDWEMCRELVCSNTKRLGERDLTRFSYLVRYEGASLEKKVDSAKKLLNVFEERLGWRKTTVCGVVSGKSEKAHKNIYAFICSPKWLRATQLVSLNLLLTRSAIRDDLGNINSIDEFKTKLKKLRYKSDDLSDLKFISEKIDLILDNIDYLFFRRPTRHNITSSDFRDGIINLIGYDTINREIAERYIKISGGK